MTAADLRIGVSVGRYQIVRRLGAGGMAEVFLAHDPRLGRDVAIKVLAGELVERPNYRLYLQREARAVARLNHPNVAQVYDVLEFQGHACFVMEYLHGEPLTARLSRGPLPLGETVQFGVQIASAVAHAHAHGILHCDLKPGNVFITTDGVAKVLDFGLARPSSHASNESLTDVGASPTLVANRAGTPGYMPPELYLGHKLDERSDIYSLGLVLMEMATGRRPPAFPLALIPVMASDTTRELRLDDPDVPPALRPIVKKAVAPAPSDRFQSAREMAAAIEAAGVHAGEKTRDIPVDARSGASGKVANALEYQETALARPRVRDLAPRILSATARGAGAAAVITLLGLVNSAALNLTLGRGQFASEGLSDWFIWGLRSMVAPGVLAAAVLVVYVIAQSLLRFVCLRWFPRMTTSVVNFVQRRDLENPVVLAHVIAASGALAIVMVYWRFSALISAFTTDISTADARSLALLREDNLLQHRHYTMILTLIIVVMVAGLWHLFTISRRRRPSDKRPIVAAGVVLTLAILMLDVPYRILYQVDRFQVVQLDGQSCYMLGETASDVLVFCPLSTPPRNRTLRRDNPRLVRQDCYGRIFDPSTKCEPR